MAAAVQLPLELLAAPTKHDLDGTTEMQVRSRLAYATALRNRPSKGGWCELRTRAVLTVSLARQVHERADMECEVSGRYTTSKRVLASQYADIYFSRLNKVLPPFFFATPFPVPTRLLVSPSLHGILQPAPFQSHPCIELP